MLGLSSLLYNAYGAPYVLSEFANTILSPFLSCFLIEKLLILSFLPLSALAMWFFVRKLGCDKPLSAWISLFYIILPSFHVAVGIYEHWPIGLCYVFTPVFLRGILAIAENSPPRNRSLRTLRCGACAELHKIAVVMSPMLLIWAIESMRQNPARIRQALLGYAWSMAVTFVTAVLVLLPASREFGMAAGFLNDPVDAWKHHYSMKTPLLWFDLWGRLPKAVMEISSVIRKCSISG